MTITKPRNPNVNTKPTNDPKVAGINEMISRSIENIAAVNPTGSEDYAETI
jgi:hypothetical protein